MLFVAIVGTIGSMENALPFDDDLPDGPVLVLAIHEGWEQPRYSTFEPAAGRDWLRVMHQTAGVACHHHYLFASVLRPTDEGRRLIAALTAAIPEGFGAWGLTLDEVNWYRGLLLPFGLDCNVGYRKAEEAIYPIDCTASALALLAEDALPTDLDDLLTFSGPMMQLCGCHNRWGIYVLDENSD